MGAYEHDVVVVMKKGAYVHGVLIFYGCLLSHFTVVRELAAQSSVIPLLTYQSNEYSQTACRRLQLEMHTLLLYEGFVILLW